MDALTFLHQVHCDDVRVVEAISVGCTLRATRGRDSRPRFPSLARQLAHATAAQRRLDFIWTKLCLGNEGHE